MGRRHTVLHSRLPADVELTPPVTPVGRSLGGVTAILDLVAVGLVVGDTVSGDWRAGSGMENDVPPPA